MNNIIISILGADGYVCQIPRIKEGMEMLGHILSKESPDIIYSNDEVLDKIALFCNFKKIKSTNYLVDLTLYRSKI